MRNLLIAVAFLAALPMTGCGALQNYQQGLDNNQNNFHRSQILLEEQNKIEVQKLQAIQRVQDIQAARAEGEKAQAKAAGDAQATIEQARGDAEATLVKAEAQAKANTIISRSLTPLLVQQNFINTINDKTITYLPNSVLMNFGQTLGKP